MNEVFHHLALAMTEIPYSLALMFQPRSKN